MNALTSLPRVSPVQRTRQAGYTLAEMLVVLLLAGLIAAISVPNLRRSRIRAQMVGEVNTFKQAVAVARINAIKNQGQVVLAFSGAIDDDTLPNTLEAWVDVDDTNRVLDGDDQLINRWEIDGDLTVAMEAGEAPFEVNSTPQRGFVFQANGVAIAAATGQPTGRGVVRLSDDYGNVIRLAVVGGAGTVTAEMAIPGTSDWDSNLRHWSY